MKENTIMKFSSRARHICRKSDLSQPMHFLSRKYDLLPKTECISCRGKFSRFSKYYLHCDTCDYDIDRNCYYKPICRMSDLTNPHKLSVRDNSFGVQKMRKRRHNRKRGLGRCHSCGDDVWGRAATYYKCETCKLYFHKVCHMYPPHITHPFHSQHPLKLTFSKGSSYSSLKNLPPSWQEEPSDSETEPDASDDISISDVKCKCCQRKLQEVYYHCDTCNFSLNLTCTRNPPPLTIFKPKSHEHILSLLPRRIPSLCDACGLSLENTHDLVYTCLPCNFMVHRRCTNLPRVIKITRHPHRLALSSSLPSGSFRCGVCRLPINVTYGQFSCQKGCHYAVHSRCAVKGRVWDGKDLYGVPEEPIEEVAPFVRIDDETIQHFSHDHYLKFNMNKNNNAWDEDRFCQACILPILPSTTFYGCISCDFILHESCASLPRRKDHPLHRHPLFLHPIPPEPLRIVHGSIPNYDYIPGMFTCNGCSQTGYGFVYRCNENRCEFQLDVRCASLTDPFIHGSHPHELFFNLTEGECMRCKTKKCSSYYMECMEDKSFLGLRCATLPSVALYKHDRHPLTLCYGEANDHYWCEICEAKLDAKKWFYICNDYCNVTVHVNCLLGKPIFLKPAASFEVEGYSFSFIRNNKSIYISDTPNGVHGHYLIFCW